MRRMKMVYEMKLNKKYFELLQRNEKKIEIRLNDEKRKDLKIEDKIIFIEEGSKTSRIETRIVGLEYFKTFGELLESYKLEEFVNDYITKEELLQDLYKFYTKERERQCGVVAIMLEKESG